MGHGKWCLGHGVDGQDESLCWGHYVEGYLIPDNFRTSHGAARVAKGFGATLHSRCDHCRSIKRWHDHSANAVRHARRFRRQHAERWVKTGRAVTIEGALSEMDVGGVTDDALALLIVSAIGEPCPGHCAFERNGQIVRHTIDKVNELHVDIRNPDEPLALENIGILCISCNLAKGRTPWALFVYRRRRQLRAWQAAIDRPEYRRGQQLGLF